MKLSIVLSAQPAKFQALPFGGDLDASLKTIAALGYEGVELAIRDPRQLDMGALAESVRAAGLQVPAVGTGQAWGEEGLSFTDPDERIRRAAVERALSHIPGAKSWNALIIIGLLRGTLKPGAERARAMDWLVAALQEFCRAAAGEGVRLALEPINRYETALINNVDQGLELLERVGAPNLGLLLDTFHMNIEEPDIVLSMRRCKGRIFHFHVADSNRHAPGAGHLRFRNMLRALNVMGYTGWVSGEFLPLPDGESAARAAIAALCAALPSRRTPIH